MNEDGEEQEEVPAEPEEIDFDWHCKSGLEVNIPLVLKEFCDVRGLKPFKVAIAGKPCTGKSFFAEQLSKHYNVPHIHTTQVLNDIENWNNEKEAEWNKKNAEINKSAPKPVVEETHVSELEKPAKSEKSHKSKSSSSSSSDKSGKSKKSKKEKKEKKDKKKKKSSSSSKSEDKKKKSKKDKKKDKKKKSSSSSKSSKKSKKSTSSKKSKKGSPDNLDRAEDVPVEKSAAQKQYEKLMAILAADERDDDEDFKPLEIKVKIQVFKA